MTDEQINAIVAILMFFVRGFTLMIAIGILSANMGFEGTLSYWQALGVSWLLRSVVSDGVSIAK